MIFVILLNFLFSRSIILASHPSPFLCKEGVIYIENNCNECECYGFDLICTLKDCESHLDPELKDCIVSNTWHVGCEQCWCIEDYPGGTICTTRCGEPVTRKSF
ncbi:hypothetical protein ILUMI_08603 [Ignelater luminosus]|uniref:Pacifastin domain-containing protein n=1 Tax=Ignelater luminosus TaxID=2038154 RepID=A0A8K0GGV5_IGNLU|nr:hypothetical protein ILUMI_08603 [Ignelater luminosus]